ncbi:PAS domain-containing sensor histidine kinase [Sphaerothrix gracilis]|uniref:PAS domain-containing sensor histidine kinase n=1 Tax=Sphaerothrix gracilis TaxID=3151835 RepID=UPI0031FC0C10
MTSLHRLNEPHTELSPLALLAETTSDLICQYDAAGHYLNANPAATLVLGLPLQLIKGQSPGALSQNAAAVDRDVLWQIQAEVTQVQQTKQSLRVIHTFPVAAGAKLYDVIYTPILDEAGEVAQIFSHGRDVTHYQTASVLEKLSSAEALVGIEMPNLERLSPQVMRETTSSPKRLSATDLKQAVRIRHSAELLQLVLDNIPHYIFWKDRNSVYLGCNRKWAEMAGLASPEAAIGLTDDDLPWTEEQKSWYVECDRQVMESNTPMLKIKQSQLQADNKLTWREVNKLPLHDAAGKVIGLLGTIEDITDRKRAEDLLKQSETRYRRLAQREELQNRLVGQIRRSLKLETILQTAVQSIRETLGSDRVLVYQLGQNWQGRILVEAVANPWRSVLALAEPERYFSETFAEQYLQGRVSALRDIHNSDLEACHVEFLNRFQVQANLVAPIHTQETLWGLLIVHQCRSSRDWQETEIELIKYLAEQLGVAIRQSALYQEAKKNAAEAQAQTCALQAAIQELKQTQAQLVQTEKMSSLGQLIAGLAHEINNPVNFIYGNVNHLEQYVQDILELLDLYCQQYPTPAAEIAAKTEEIDLPFLTEDIDKILQSLKVGTSRIRQIVLSLRNFSRLDESVVKSVDIHEGIDSTVIILQHRLKPTAERMGITVVRDYGELPIVECYPGQLNQVFMNILSNAIDALEEAIASGRWADTPLGHDGQPEQGPYIEIRTQALETNRIAIYISDNGPGIPETLKQEIFDPFFTTKPIGKGTGLGLSISHQIVVEKHRGYLNCASSAEEGTQFYIEIPVTQLDSLDSRLSETPV